MLTEQLRQKSQPSNEVNKVEEAFDTFCTLRALIGMRTNLERVWHNAPVPSQSKTKKRRFVRGHFMRDMHPRIESSMARATAQKDIVEQKFRRQFSKLTLDEKQEFYELRQRELV